MVSQRRLFILLTALIFIGLFAVACERPLTNPDDGTTPTTQPDADVGGGVDGGGQADDAADEAAVSEAANANEEDSAAVDSSETPADAGDDAQDDSSEVGGGAGDAGDTAGDDEQAAGDDAAADTAGDETADTVTDDVAADETADTAVPATHTVAAGENLYRIGLKYGISWVAIANENGLTNPNILTVGQELKLPGAAAPTVEPTPSPQTETTYIVQPGDNLFRIGLRFGISWVQIAEANGLVNPNLIEAGNELKIPVNTPGPAPQFSHVVKPGDTLFLISLQYGVAWPTIAEANNLSSPYVIYVGQTLEIPGSQ